MKDKKLNQILAAARQETPPVVPTGFAERVKHALVNEAISQPVVVAFWDQLNRNFTRYTVAAAAAIVMLSVGARATGAAPFHAYPSLYSPAGSGVLAIAGALFALGLVFRERIQAGVGRLLGHRGDGKAD